MIAWAYVFYQIYKIAGCSCAGNAGNVFPRHRCQRKPLVSDPGIPHVTCVTHVPWCMSGSLIRSDGENFPGIPSACATRNFVYLVRGPYVLVPRVIIDCRSEGIRGSAEILHYAGCYSVVFWSNSNFLCQSAFNLDQRRNWCSFWINSTQYRYNQIIFELGHCCHSVPKLHNKPVIETDGMALM